MSSGGLQGRHPVALRMLIDSTGECSHRGIAAIALHLVTSRELVQGVWNFNV